jgi:hypothetical protein
MVEKSSFRFPLFWNSCGCCVTFNVPFISGIIYYLSVNNWLMSFIAVLPLTSSMSQKAPAEQQSFSGKSALHPLDSNLSSEDQFINS